MVSAASSTAVASDTATPKDIATPLSLPYPSLWNSSPSLIQLQYVVDSVSSYSAHFHPRFIHTNQPHDQSSRWASGASNQSQFLILRLKEMSLVDRISFGKYYKMHICNLKEFKIYGGLNKEQWIELCHAGLRNDAEMETFLLDAEQGLSVQQAAGEYGRKVIPIRYLKIVPLLAWGANFNYSIWYIALWGSQDPLIMEPLFYHFALEKERKIQGLILKYQRNQGVSLQHLRSIDSLSLEHVWIKEILEQCLHGQYEALLESMKKVYSHQWLESVALRYPMQIEWQRLGPHSGCNSSNYPPMRGGHQMVVHQGQQSLYLFGGWDGSRDLSDFWCYSTQSHSWQCLSNDESGGPSARSCHKMIMDNRNHCKYVDPEQRQSQHECDFWKYSIESHQWIKLSSHTLLEGGPPLIYDHQMALDEKRQILYVFGGRIIDDSTNSNNSNNNANNSSNSHYSGLYSFDIEKNVWKCLHQDDAVLNGNAHCQIQFKSRIGHSMLLDEERQHLIIFAGQRHKDYLGDFIVYDLTLNQVIYYIHDVSIHGGPDPGFTQRAIYLPESREILVMSGLMRDRHSAMDTFKNTLYGVRLESRDWHCLYSNSHVGEAYWRRMNLVEPCPRFAHQFCWLLQEKETGSLGCGFVFGGNGGEALGNKMRLDDFWKVSMKRVTSQDILRRLTFLIKRFAYLEGVQSNKRENAFHALQELQDFCVGEEQSLMGGLAAALFATDSPAEKELDKVYSNRLLLFDWICEWMPKEAVLPRENLLNLFIFFKFFRMLVGLLFLFFQIHTCSAYYPRNDEVVTLTGLERSKAIYNDMIGVAKKLPVDDDEEIQFCVTVYHNNEMDEVYVKTSQMVRLKTAMPVQVSTLEEELENLVANKAMSKFKDPPADFYSSSEMQSFLNNQFTILINNGVYRYEADSKVSLKLNEPKSWYLLRIVGGQIYQKYGFHGLVYFATWKKKTQIGIDEYFRRAFNGIGEFQA